MIYVICLLILVIGILGYVVYNLLTKVEFYEDFCIDLALRVREIVKDITTIDERGAFRADDEVGDVFNQIKAVVLRLTEFTGEESATKTQGTN